MTAEVELSWLVQAPSTQIQSFLKPHIFLTWICVYGAYNPTPQSGFKNIWIYVDKALEACFPTKF